jgi:hypothetical protein
VPKQWWLDHLGDVHCCSIDSWLDVCTLLCRVLVIAGLGPLLLQPFALFFPESWEHRHSVEFTVLFIMEIVGCLVLASLTLTSSYRSASATRVSSL